MSIASWPLWIAFHVFVVAALLVDLLVLHRGDRVVRKREAAGWSIVWVTCAMVFSGGVAWGFGADKSLEFVAGYLIEKSLSVDNLFVFLMLFRAFRVPDAYQHRVLFWGVFGAIMLRAIMIALGVGLIRRFEPVILVFAGLLVFSAIQLFLEKEEGDDLDIEHHRLVRWVRKVLPLSERYEGSRFFTRSEDALRATPLFLVLVVVELSDVMFAVDSIPAVFGVSQDPFIVYTSNIFAILGLRALYFLLASALAGLRFLKPSLALVLLFVGGKMIAAYFGVHVPIGIALGVVGALLGIGVALSLLWPASAGPAPAPGLTPDLPAERERPLSERGESR